MGGCHVGLRHARRDAAAGLLAGARVARAPTAVDRAARPAAEGARHRRRAASLVVAGGAGPAPPGGAPRGHGQSAAPPAPAPGTPADGGVPGAPPPPAAAPT